MSINSAEPTTANRNLPLLSTMVPCGASRALPSARLAERSAVARGPHPRSTRRTPTQLCSVFKTKQKKHPHNNKQKNNNNNRRDTSVQNPTACVRSPASSFAQPESKRGACDRRDLKSSLLSTWSSSRQLRARPRAPVPTPSPAPPSTTPSIPQPTRVEKMRAPDYTLKETSLYNCTVLFFVCLFLF